MTIEWLEILSPVAPAMGIDVGGQVAADNLVTLRNLIVHDTASHGINLQWPGLSAVVSNNFIYDTGADGIHHDPNPGLQPGRYVHILNNTVRNAGLNAYGASNPASALLLRNNICSLAGGLCYVWGAGHLSRQQQQLRERLDGDHEQPGRRRA